MCVCLMCVMYGTCVGYVRDVYACVMCVMYVMCVMGVICDV